MSDLQREVEWLLKEKYQGEKTSGFFADCKALSLGTPLAYLIGWVPFLNCKIWLDNQPLIPRPETEFWTAEAISVIKGSQTPALSDDREPTKILDLCAGSGCIGVAVAKQLLAVQVDLGEINKSLLPTIKKNLAENIIEPHSHQVIQTNGFSNLNRKYNFILSNPPYIDENLSRTETSVIDNEPHLALFGGEAGLEIITNIIKAAPQQLAPGGQLWLEHEPEQSPAINQLAEQYNFSITNHVDQYKVERYSILVLQ